MVRLHRPTLPSPVPLTAYPHSNDRPPNGATLHPSLALSARFSLCYARTCTVILPSLLCLSLFRRMGFAIFFLLSCRHKLSLSQHPTRKYSLSITRILSLTPLHPLVHYSFLLVRSRDWNFYSERAIRNESHRAVGRITSFARLPSGPVWNNWTLLYLALVLASPHCIPRSCLPTPSYRITFADSVSRRRISLSRFSPFFPEPPASLSVPFLPFAANGERTNVRCWRRRKDKET